MLFIGPPLNLWVPVLLDDAADLPTFQTNPQRLTQAIYVGTGGDVVAVSANGAVVTWKNVPSSTLLPIGVRRINATGTTALNLLACYVA